jgi:hypothetical protein
MHLLKGKRSKNNCIKYLKILFDAKAIFVPVINIKSFI